MSLIDAAGATREILGASHDSERFLKGQLLTRDAERAIGIIEPELLLRFPKKIPKDWMVQVRRFDDEPPTVDPHAHRHVSRRNIGRYLRNRSLLPPPFQHLAEPYNVPYTITPPHKRKQKRKLEEREKEVKFGKGLKGEWMDFREFSFTVWVCRGELGIFVGLTVFKDLYIGVRVGELPWVF